MDCEKDTFLSMKAKTRRQNATLFDISWEHALLVTQFLAAVCICMSANKLESTSHIDLKLQISFSQ